MLFLCPFQLWKEYFNTQFLFLFVLFFSCVSSFSYLCLGHLHSSMSHFLPSFTLALHQLQLWDTAGQERFRKSMVQHYYRNVHAVLFIYDVTCPVSFTGLSSWVEECRQNSVGQEIPRCVCTATRSLLISWYQTFLGQSPSYD